MSPLPARPEAPAQTRPAGPGTLRTARLLVGLKARLTIAAMRRSTAALVGSILGLVWFLVSVLLWSAAAWSAGGSLNPQEAATPAVLVGTAGTLGWWLASLATGRADSTLHAGRFALYPVPVRGLALGQILGAAVGIGGPLTAIALLGMSLVWRSSPVALVSAVVLVPLGWFVMILGNRCLTAALEGLQRRRGVTEALSILGAAALILVGPLVGGALGLLAAQGLSALAGLAGWLAWTPWGAAWAIPADLAQGRLLSALARLLVVLASGAVLWAIWSRLLERSFEHAGAPAPSRGGHQVRGAGVFGRLPARPWAAVAGRSVIYWLRDPRYAASLAIMPLMLIMLWFLSLTTQVNGQDAGWILLAAGPLTAVLLGFSISADVAYDHSAFCLHLLTGLRGRDDRLGRVIGLLLVSVPLLAVILAGSALLADAGHLLPGLVGVTLLGLLAGAGVSSVLSARYTYPVPLPGDSPMKTPPGFTLLNVLVQMATMLVIVLLTLPALAPLILQGITGQGLWGWFALAIGAVLGPVLCWLGIVLGGRWLEARGPELLQQVSSYRS